MNEKTNLAAGTPAPLVSVIVPVYKVEKYLAECIESVLAQTFKDFELILVDDGSPDNSGKICDDYAARDSRIRVFHKENGGVSSARNLGLDKARGEWITFVDSDDKLFPNALEALIKIGKKDNSIDLVEGNISRTEKSFQEKQKIKIRYTKTENYILKIGVTFNTGPYAKLIRRSAFGNGEFDIPRWINKGEDHLMLDRISLKIRNALKINIPVYFYRENAQSVTSSVPLTMDYSIRYIEFLKNWFNLEIPIQKEAFYVHIQQIFIGMFLHTKDWRECKSNLMLISDKINRKCVNKRLGYRISNFANRLPLGLRELAWFILKIRMVVKRKMFKC